MEDKDFDNIFGDKLKEQKEFSFSEQKWTVLERQYDQLLAENRYKKLLLFGSLSLLALLSSLFWTLFSLDKTNKKLDDLTHQIQVAQPNKMQGNTPSVYWESIAKSDHQNQKSDSIFHKIVVYHYDTIYQTVIRQDILKSNLNALDNKNQTAIIENILNEPENKKTNTSKSVIIESQNPIILNKKDDFTIEKTLTEQQHNSVPIKAESSPQKDSVNLVQTTSILNAKDSLFEKAAFGKMLHPLSINLDSTLKNSEKIFDKELEKQETKKQPIINRIKIKGYELGITSGVAFINNSSIMHQAGYSFGLKGGVLLGRRLHLIGEAQSLNLNFETNRFDEKLNISPISPPTTNDDLRSVNVSQYYGQLALGLKYQFMDGKRWQPYLSSSIVGQASSYEESSYKFINRLTNGYTIMKFKRRGDDFEMGTLRTAMGVNYRIGRKFQGFLEGSYDFKFDKTPQYKQIGQVKIGLLYRF